MTKDHTSIEKYVDSYAESFQRYRQESFFGLRPIPSMNSIELIIEDLLELLFPGRSGRTMNDYQVLRFMLGELMEKVARELEQQMFLAWYHENHLNVAEGKTDPYRQLARTALEALLAALPDLRILMREDARAAYDGDPAATSIQEIIICYPGVRALTLHRIAHFLHRQGVPLIPRMIGETIHKQTGIDIHPGATIGSCLFIDHGTGVVIGETSIIGNQVKLYQGVTLGALSFPKDERGKLIRGTKRHPTLEDRVTVYANATILGDITVGSDTIIGSSVWIKESVPSNTLVQLKDPKITLRPLKPKATPPTCEGPHL